MPATPQEDPGRTSPDRLAAIARRPEVAELYLRGLTQAAIAERFAVNQGQISRDLRAVQRVWVKQAALGLDKIKAKDLAKLDQIEREAWDAWERSKKDFERQKITAAGQKKNRIEKLTEGQTGNPRYLEVVLRCIERRCAMLGIDKTTLEHSGKVDVNHGGAIATKIDADPEARELALKLFERIASGES